MRGTMQEAGGQRGEPVMLEREAERQRAAGIIRSRKLILQKLSFAVVELRLHLTELLALRLALSELGCTQQAWVEINDFKDRATAYLSRS